MTTELISFLYLYGVGGALFVGSIFLAWKRGALDLQTSGGKKVLAFLVLGYAVFIAYHAVTQFVLPGAVGG